MKARRLIRLFEHVIESFCTLFGLATGALILLMCVDIALRQLSVGSLPWLIELMEYTLYAGTFLAAPWLLHQRAHVRVDVLLTVLPRHKEVVLERFIDTAGLGIALVLLWFGSSAVYEAFGSDMVQHKTWNVPEGVLLLPIPVGGALLAIELTLRIFRIKRVAEGDIGPAGRADS